MANHKRHRMKAQRAGCLLCKPHKAMGNAKGATKPQYRHADDTALFQHIIPQEFGGTVRQLANA